MIIAIIRVGNSFSSNPTKEHNPTTATIITIIIIVNHSAI